MDVGRSQARGEGSVFQPLEKALIELLVGLKFVLQDILLNQKLVQLFEFNLLPGQRLRDHGLPLLGGNILPMVALHDALPFGFEAGPDFFGLVPEPDDLGEIGPVLLAGFDVLRLQLGVFLLEP